MARIEHSLFEKLPPWTQAQLLAQQGLALASRQHLDWTIHLYSWQNQLIEVWARKGLEIVTVFKADAAPLDIYEPYLAALSIPGRM